MTTIPAATLAKMAAADPEMRPAKRQRCATKAQLAHRAARTAAVLNAAPCAYCSEPLGGHTVQQMLDCANARS